MEARQELIVRQAEGFFGDGQERRGDSSIAVPTASSGAKSCKSPIRWLFQRLWFGSWPPKDGSWRPNRGSRRPKLRSWPLKVGNWPLNGRSWFHNRGS